MKKTEPKVTCATPTPGKSPTRIPQWKYQMVRRAIRRVVPKSKDGVAFRDLPGLVAEVLTSQERARLGSVSWHATTVKLHMETVGELERVAGAHPQRLRRKA